MRENELVIRPVKSDDEYLDDILRGLVAQGYSGQELIEEFKKARLQVRSAVQRLIDEADHAVQQLTGSSDDEMTELFGKKEGNDPEV